MFMKERVFEVRKLADRMLSSEMCDHHTISITIKNFVVRKLIVPERHERQKYIYICISRGDNNDVLVEFVRWLKTNCFRSGASSKVQLKKQLFGAVVKKKKKVNKIKKRRIKIQTEVCIGKCCLGLYSLK